jgi:endonuclease YncB( thermonuclease family)
MCLSTALGRDYPAVATRAVDGDTLVCDVDLGFGVWMRGAAVRVLGFDAVELRTPRGPAARDAASALVLGKKLTLITGKREREKYGRLLAVVTLPDGRDFAGEMEGWKK